MSPVKCIHDSVFKYMEEFSSRVVAESGLPEDRYHLGKLIFRALEEDQVFQLHIDGSKNESETNESVLLRTKQCAVIFKDMGLKKGDVVMLMGSNHIDIAIPLYAAMYLGLSVAVVDASIGLAEIIDLLRTTQPKIVFLNPEVFYSLSTASRNCEVYFEYVAFREGADCQNLKEFIEFRFRSHEYNITEKDVEDFKPADIDPAETVALLTTTGMTGFSRFVAHTHKSLTLSIPYIWSGETNFPTPTKLALLVAPPQWLSTGIHFLASPILKYTRLQISEQLTKEVFAKVVNKYKPTYTAMSATLLKSLWTTNRSECDMTCFESIWLLGSAVSEDLLEDIKRVRADIKTVGAYGINEACGLVFNNRLTKKGSVGKPLEILDVKLVNPETLEEISEPNVKGELWLRGPGVFKGYYKYPEINTETFEKDGWFKSGDTFYRDDEGDFYFVERLKSQLKYKNYQISMKELEAVVRQHPGVQDVEVLRLPDSEFGELPIVIVTEKSNHKVAAQEIKTTVHCTKSDELIFSRQFNSFPGEY